MYVVYNQISLDTSAMIQLNREHSPSCDHCRSLLTVEHLLIHALHTKILLLFHSILPCDFKKFSCQYERPRNQSNASLHFLHFCNVWDY